MEASRSPLTDRDDYCLIVRIVTNFVVVKIHSFFLFVTRETIFLNINLLKAINGHQYLQHFNENDAVTTLYLMISNYSYESS